MTVEERLAAALEAFLAGRLPYERLVAALRRAEAEAGEAASADGGTRTDALAAVLDRAVEAGRLPAALAGTIRTDAARPPPDDAAPGASATARHDAPTVPFPATDDPPATRAPDPARAEVPLADRVDEGLVSALAADYRAFRERKPAADGDAARPDPATDALLAPYAGARIRHDAARASAGRENPVRRESRRRAQRAAPADGPAVGDLLKNRFLLDETLGAGGMGVVFRAVDLRRLEAGHAAPYVAVKVLGPDLARDHRAFQTLEAEARKAQRLAHPNVIHIHDFDRDGAHAFVVMELLEGRDLAGILAEEGPLPFERVRRIVGPVCAALSHAHASGVIHADVKPGNVFVGTDGTVKVLDFGIASAKGLSGFDVSTLGSFTSGYASPDVLKGRPQTERDDVYALGCTVYEALAGRHPFSSRHALDAIALGLAPARPSGVPGTAWRAIARALAFERDRRFESVEAFRRAFERRGPLARLFARRESAAR